MTEFLIAAGAAFWLGILTSISPCPLATNVTAVSFIGKQMSSPRNVLFSGLLYTLGRTIAYTVLGVILVSGILSAPGVSYFLQKQMNVFAGPLMILVGMVLLDMIPLKMGTGSNVVPWLQKRVGAWKLWGPLLLGILFALSFCPVSAALFFGSLLPIAVRHESGLAIPGIYGIATGLPAFLFAVLLAFGTNRIAHTYKRLVMYERWARRITAILFIAVGIYFCLVYMYGLSF